MRYTGSLVKQERAKIFELFLRKPRLKFSEIERHLKIRSNMVSYHLRQMENEGLLIKETHAREGFAYKLTPKAERYLPIYEHLVGEEIGPVPVVLVAIVRAKRILLVKRTKRPYQGYWSMVGGKIRHDESIADATVRLVQDRTGLAGKFKGANAILHERISERGTHKHSFILIMTTFESARGKPRESAHGELAWFPFTRIAKERDRIIPSDYHLIVHEIGSHIPFSSARMQEDDGVLSGFSLDIATANGKRLRKN